MACPAPPAPVRAYCRRVDLARPGAGSPDVLLRPGASIRRGPAPRHRDRRGYARAGARARGRRRQLRRDGAGERQDPDDSDAVRARREPHAARLDHRGTRCERRGGRRRRDGRPERHARVRRAVRPSRHPRRVERPGLSRSARVPAGARAAGACARAAAAGRARTCAVGRARCCAGRRACCYAGRCRAGGRAAGHRAIPSGSGRRACAGDARPGGRSAARCQCTCCASARGPAAGRRSRGADDSVARIAVCVRDSGRRPIGPARTVDRNRPGGHDRTGGRSGAGPLHGLSRSATACCGPWVECAAADRARIRRVTRALGGMAAARASEPVQFASRRRAVAGGTGRR